MNEEKKYYIGLRLVKKLRLEGKTWGYIAKRLNREGYRTKTGKKYTKGNLMNMASKDKNTGIVTLPTATTLKVESPRTVALKEFIKSTNELDIAPLQKMKIIVNTLDYL